VELKMNARKLAKIFAYAVLAGGALLDTAAPALAAETTTPASPETATVQTQYHIKAAGKERINPSPQPPPNCVDNCFLQPGMHRHPYHWQFKQTANEHTSITRTTVNARAKTVAFKQVGGNGCGAACRVPRHHHH
jgi:hypothetical protein